MHHQTSSKPQSYVHLMGSSFGHLTEASHRGNTYKKKKKERVFIRVFYRRKTVCCILTWLDRWVVPFKGKIHFQRDAHSTLKCYCLTMEDALQRTTAETQVRKQTNKQNKPTTLVAQKSDRFLTSAKLQTDWIYVRQM